MNDYMKELLEKDALLNKRRRKLLDELSRVDDEMRINTFEMSRYQILSGEDIIAREA